MQITPTTVALMQAQFELTKKITESSLAADDFMEQSEKFRIAPREFGYQIKQGVYGILAVRKDDRNPDLRQIVIGAVDETDGKTYQASSTSSVTQQDIMVWLNGGDQTVNERNIDNMMRVIKHICDNYLRA